MKTKITLLEANRIIETAEGLFNRAAKAWERGNLSGNSEYLARCENQCDTCRTRAEKLLKPLGISVDYPGLYPSFMVKGGSYNTTESAVSAAIAADWAGIIDALESVALASNFDCAGVLKKQAQAALKTLNS